MTRFAELFRVDEEKRTRLQTMLASMRQPTPVRRFNPSHTREEYVAVEGGSIRVLHHTPPAPVLTDHPIVFVPGWGTVEKGFTGFFNLLDGRAECLYIETREKNSSRIDRYASCFSMPQKARDVAAVLRYFGLDAEARDFTLVGTCWGSAVIAEGMIAGVITAPRTVLFDPMHSLWFPKWILKWISPLTPVLFWRMIRPLAKVLALWGMNEQSQRRRAELFIDGAEIWKWKRCAEEVREFELEGRLGEIRSEVLVVNGVRDKIHDQSYYPALASEIPGGRFFYLPVEEHQREELIALAPSSSPVEPAASMSTSAPCQSPFPRLDPSGCRDV